MERHAAVSADDVLSLASTFGVNLQEEPHLLPLVRQFLYTPLPPGWKVVKGAYVDELRGGSSQEHPARSYFVRAINEARQKAGDVVSPKSQRTKVRSLGSPSKDDRDKQEMWIDLYDDDGNLYYEDLLSGARTLEAPSFTQLPPAIAESGMVASMADLPQAPWEVGASPPPPRLQFRAWFQECSSIRTSLIRRELTITYVVAEGTFHVKISGTDKEYTVSHIMGKLQTPLTHLDLHTGAVIDVLGKATTLMQADLVTSEWIDGETKRLTSLAEKVSAEMRKYGLNPPGSSTSGLPSSAVAFRTYKNPAHGDIRQLMRELEALYAQLQEMRPQAAAKIARIAARPGRTRASTQKAGASAALTRGVAASTVVEVASTTSDEAALPAAV